ncbi:Bug family tripartite tricarboxylate transporter substrate binding protein [Actinomadura alba]|uniref:Tripartite tricarboxylate transporter substrate binding protein n=1 Tax=Actinomadura alba TaxID=406431 RepID=A0ABR7M011_9ACTN|nr:tripartite tricarboxylate transporter substrate binding protein [Actinomadura alba]MBC6470067.1 tripartite tricarboxylate transporter substrate binding protein [Actinomadura alba]
MRGLRTFAATAVAVALTVTGCAGSGSDTAGKPVTGLRVMVPNTPGGGYDVTARTAAKAAEDAKLARNIEVFNLPGAGGTVGLARLVNEKGNGKLAMSMGLGVVGSVYTNKSKATLQQTTPVARLLQEPDIIVVPKDSRYKTIGDLVKAWKADPGKLPVGGGSSPGGPDHLAPMLTAKAAGLVPKDVNYVPYDGGGELLAAILGKQVAFGVSGVGEYADQVKAGQLRVLAVTSAQRVPGVDAPTLKESGIDVEFVNWRGIVAPPGLDAKEIETLRTLVRKLRESQQWKDALARNGWTDAYLEGDQFGAFVQQENTRVGSVLKDLGLA